MLSLSPYGTPGTIGVKTHKQFTAWCVGCNEEWADFFITRKEFEKSIREKGWRRIGKKWHCQMCAMSKKDGSDNTMRGSRMDAGYGSSGGF
jgi:hypothetical protein